MRRPTELSHSHNDGDGHQVSPASRPSAAQLGRKPPHSRPHPFSTARPVQRTFPSSCSEYSGNRKSCATCDQVKGETAGKIGQNRKRLVFSLSLSPAGSSWLIYFSRFIDRVQSETGKSRIFIGQPLCHPGWPLIGLVFNEPLCTVGLSATRRITSRLTLSLSLFLVEESDRF